MPKTTKPKRAWKPSAHNACSKKRQALKARMRSLQNEVTHLTAETVVLQSQLDYNQQTFQLLIDSLPPKTMVKFQKLLASLLLFPEAGLVGGVEEE